MRGGAWACRGGARGCKGGMRQASALWPTCAARVDESGRSTLGVKVQSSSSLAACTPRSRRRSASRLVAHFSHRRAMSSSGYPPSLSSSRWGLDEHCRSPSASRSSSSSAPAYSSRGWRHPARVAVRCRSSIRCRPAEVTRRAGVRHDEMRRCRGGWRRRCRGGCGGDAPGAQQLTSGRRAVRVDP